jgi:hypothetical protein
VLTEVSAFSAEKIRVRVEFECGYFFSKSVYQREKMILRGGISKRLTITNLQYADV